MARYEYENLIKIMTEFRNDDSMLDTSSLSSGFQRLHSLSKWMK